jgi:nitrous oxidase accessory protein NosD
MNIDSVPANPLGGKTLIVDCSGQNKYMLPSEAIHDMGESDQVYVRPGIYEDKIFVSQRPIRLVGAGRDLVQIFSRRGGPLYLQEVPEGWIAGITFRYVGSDQHSALNILNSTCTIRHCRAMEGILSGVVLYGPQCGATLVDNEVCRNRESGIFIFAGAYPRVTDNHCFDNHHFGIAVRDPGSHPELVRNRCEGNMLSGILLFQDAESLIVDNLCQNNQQWGLLLTPDARPNPSPSELPRMNQLTPNPLGSYSISDQPLAEIGR